MAAHYFGADSQWYLGNIPFFECSDTSLEQVYYYRWKLFKAHIRNTGPDQYVITEFINHVAWDREPYCTINAASMHHIHEGRWLKDPRYINGYINHLYQDSGNDRRYSESIADAAYANYLVNADSAFLVHQYYSMMKIFEQWSDHYDSSKHLYFIPAMPDATEYTVASIDASGGKDGFDDGEAFRPTINSYMYANALAIAWIAYLKNDSANAKLYFNRAADLQQHINADLWNDSAQHYLDRFKVDNQYVHYWNFIRARELAGMIPWYYEIPYNLPPDSPNHFRQWEHVLDTNILLGKYGLRTNEPAYQYYFKQFVFYQGQRGSQWNGPSWPYQNSQVITAMANMLNTYDQKVVTNSDYLKLLRQFARQHYLPNGNLNLVENYDPNLGGPIVYYYWSNHYNHSSFNDLIISGLCGIRPQGGGTLIINPLIDSSIKYFCLDDLRYHGHKVSVVYDEDGSRYKVGKGVTVFVDGKKAEQMTHGKKIQVRVGQPILSPPDPQPVNYALNIAKKPYPAPSASINSVPDSLYQSIDGRIWYFTEITNHWTTQGSTSMDDWYSLDFGKPVQLSSAKIYLCADNTLFDKPGSIFAEYKQGGQWLPVKFTQQFPSAITGNTVNRFVFDKISTTTIRFHFRHSKKQVAVSEIECY